jgi:predicted ATP-dependent endonuclease of OLD family
MYQINTLYLDEDSFSNYTYLSEPENHHYLTNLSKINLLVGANNSGKSRFMRTLFAQESIKYNLANIDIEAINHLILNLKSNIDGVLNHKNIADYSDIKKDIDKVVLNHFFSEGKNNFESFIELLRRIRIISGSPAYTTKGIGRTLLENDFQWINSTLTQLAEGMLEDINVPAIEKGAEPYLKIYIPTLRGLRPLDKDTDFYTYRTQKDYFDNQVNNNNNIKIFTGVNMYEEVKDLLLGTLEERKQISEYQEFLSKNFFDDKSVLLLPNKKSDVLYVKIGNETERPIFSLGDGIQSVIIMTFQVFYNRGKKCLFFIEEPEIYLHPGLQRKLIKALCTFDECQFFLTTHSNHILDLSLELEVKDMSIYKFNKVLDENENLIEVTPDFEIENVSSGDNSLLDILGVKDSSVYLANCTIWVEGITDRFYLRGLYLDYIKQSRPNEFVYLKEDINYAFVEYAGNNITHWSFLGEYSDDGVEDEVYRNINVESICKKIFLITDRDSEKKQARHEKLKENLKNNYCCLDVKEIENLISLKTLKKVIKEYEKVNTVEDIDFKSNFTEKGYANRYLGSFIESVLNNPSRSYSAQSGTIKDKLAFCKRAIKNTSNVNDLSPEALNLCEKIYNFIKENNK